MKHSVKHKIVYMSFPTDDIKGAVCQLYPEHPEEYTIFINSNYPEEVQHEALEHELKHLELDHFKRVADGEITVAQAEIEAHRAIEEERQWKQNQ